MDAAPHLTEDAARAVLHQLAERHEPHVACITTRDRRECSRKLEGIAWPLGYMEVSFSWSGFVHLSFTGTLRATNKGQGSKRL